MDLEVKRKTVMTLARTLPMWVCVDTGVVSLPYTLDLALDSLLLPVGLLSILTMLLQHGVVLVLLCSDRLCQPHVLPLTHATPSAA